MKYFVFVSRSQRVALGYHTHALSARTIDAKAIRSSTREFGVRRHFFLRGRIALMPDDPANHTDDPEASHPTTEISCQGQAKMPVVGIGLGTLSCLSVFFIAGIFDRSLAMYAFAGLVVLTAALCNLIGVFQAFSRESLRTIAIIGCVLTAAAFAVLAILFLE